MKIEHFASYGEINISKIFKATLKDKLKKTPIGFRSAISHAKICSFYSKCLFNQINILKSTNLDIIIWSHFLRAGFKHFDKRGKNFIANVKSDIDYAADFANELNESVLAQIVVKYRKGYDAKIWEELKLEDIIFLIAGATVAGIKNINNGFYFMHMEPEERKKNISGQYNTDDSQIIAQEYDNFLIPIWNILKKEIDIKKCVRDTQLYMKIYNQRSF